MLHPGFFIIGSLLWTENVNSVIVLCIFKIKYLFLNPTKGMFTTRHYYNYF